MIGWPPTVFLVDDDPTVRFVFRDILTSEGHPVEVFEHPQALP